MNTIRNILIPKNANSFSQFVRGSIVSFLSTIIDFTVLFLLTLVFCNHYIICNTFSYIIGTATNYMLTNIYVFEHHKYNNILIEILLFVILSIIGLIINDYLLFLFAFKFKLSIFFSKILSSSIVYFWNYYSKKFIIYYKKI